MTRALSFVLAAFVTISLFAGRAHADEPRRAGTVRLEAMKNDTPGHGPLELVAGEGGFSGTVAVTNEGKEPLVVSRIAVRGDIADPRVPPKVTVHLDQGALPMTVAPGATRRAIVLWTPERGARQRQLFGHVIVTTSDERSGEVAMGIRAQLPEIWGRLESRVLSLAIGLPLLGALAIFVTRLLRRGDERRIALGALGAAAVVGLYIHRHFAHDVSRLDGNDGLQFVERAVWIRGISAELFLGVDGIAAMSIVAVLAISFFALLRERGSPRGAPGYYTAYLALTASAVGALASMDALLFLLFTAIAVVSATLLVGGWGGDGRRQAATRLAVFGLGAAALLLVVVLAAARNADPTFLVDGASATTTFGLPDLSRVSFGAKDATLFGFAIAKPAFVLALLASLVFLGAFPLHGWLAPSLATAPPSTAALVSAVMPSIGIVVLLRIGFGVFPEGARWASGVVVALGAVSAAYGALGVLGETDLARGAAYATTCQCGFVLLGAGSLTPQGIAGAVVIGATRALACAALLLLVASLDERVHTRDTSRLAGILTRTPSFAAAIAAAGFGVAGVLGLAGAWGPILALFGALSSYGPLAVTAAIALVVAAAAYVLVIARMIFGRLDRAWEKNPLLEAGGRVPPLTPREWASIGPLLAIVILAGMFPAPIVGAATGAVRDLVLAVNP